MQDLKDNLWAVQIVGGIIATVVGGLLLGVIKGPKFHGFAITVGIVVGGLVAFALFEYALLKMGVAWRDHFLLQGDDEASANFSALVMNTLITSVVAPIALYLGYRIVSWLENRLKP